MLECNSDIKELWGKVCAIARDRLSIESYEQWIHPIVPLSVKGAEITLGVSDDFFADWLTRQFGDIMDEALFHITGNSFEIKFKTGFMPEENDLIEELSSAATKKEDVNDDASSSDIAHGNSLPNCLLRHTFSNFVVGEENRYAFTAAQTAAKSPGVYNPLYIFGSTGMGKTHLLQAVAHEVLAADPSAVVNYITCEEFLNRYVDSLRLKKHSEFRNFVRGSDLLLVDDVHQLAGKSQLQEEFFNTFNTLYNSGKQIILTSDRQPSEIKGLEERLITRFEWGVTTEITAPCLETRLAILRTKQEEHMIKLDDEVLFFLAARITSSVRRLEGALLRLVAFSSAMSNCKITCQLAEELLDKVLEEEIVNQKISIENIQKKVAEYYDIRVHDLLGSKRPKNIAEPRMIAMYLTRKMTDHSYPEIGLAFGGRTHATVMHAEKKITAECRKNENLKRTIAMIQRQIQG